MTDNLPVPEWFDARAVFAKFEQGKTSDAIAKDLGVKRIELVKQLKKHPDHFREVRAALQYVRLEDALDAMDAAAERGDTQKVKCYESVIRSAQWELERVNRQVYGETKEKSETTPVIINIGIERDADDPVPIRHQPADDAVVLSESPKCGGTTYVQGDFVKNCQEMAAPLTAPTPQAPVKKKSPPQCVTNMPFDYDSIPLSADRPRNGGFV